MGFSLSGAVSLCRAENSAIYKLSIIIIKSVNTFVKTSSSVCQQVKQTIQLFTSWSTFAKFHQICWQQKQTLQLYKFFEHTLWSELQCCNCFQSVNKSNKQCKSWNTLIRISSNVLTEETSPWSALWSELHRCKCFPLEGLMKKNRLQVCTRFGQPFLLPGENGEWHLNLNN